MGLLPRNADLGAALAALILTAPGIAHAGDGTAAPGLLELSVRAGGALALVLAVLVGLAALVKRLRLAPAAAAGDKLVSRARLDLGHRREIRLVEAGGHLLVVGATGEQVTLLADVSAGAGDSVATLAPRLAGPLGVVRGPVTTSP